NEFCLPHRSRRAMSSPIQFARAGRKSRPRSLVNATERDLDWTREVARSLLGGEVDAVCAVNGGRNSRIYRVEHAGCVYALKQYPGRAEDPRDRLGTEVAALALMERHGVGGVPRVLAVDRAKAFALLTWLDGVPVAG